ncbi:hypothetical protein A1E_01085 [Rickettsia canadensis str. McKiel]|uniref:Uncharacterized protein n=1 Tax=Rickettsia canadensis (strain McKiel) TaxID=293613 RepID=A8EXS9_RICCK|nr:hypothetical protein [Rickettsia canadensis]ABV73162.1 hypothetical protein A1E_01085 [Rickettsia canadensis str. McKiel]
MIIDSTSTDLPIARVSGINLPMAGLVSSETTNTNLTNYTDIGAVILVHKMQLLAWHVC